MIFPESEITFDLGDINEEEIKILKNKFHSFTEKIKILITESKLFKEESGNKFFEETRYNSNSVTNFQQNGRGISVSWKNKWDTFKIYVFTDSKWSNIEYIPISIEIEDGKLKCSSCGDMDLELTHYNCNELSISNSELIFLKTINKEFQNLIYEVREENISNIQKLSKKQSIHLGNLDKNQDGNIDLIDCESFNKLLKNNQNVIINKNETYIQKFVKISMYLKTKKSNSQKIFESIKDTKNENELNELVNLLKNQIHTYELLVFHSISMITSLVHDDFITFYEIYECFDQLGVFNSNWENEVSNKLTDIGDGIKDLMYSIYQMENKIVNSIDNLTYVTQDSFKELSYSVEKQLSGIDSTIKFNNLLTGIQTYQMYKINQNTKRIG